jgi:hypothetical protein
MVLPSETTIAGADVDPLITIQFLSVELITGVVPLEPTQITLELEALVLVIVKFLVVLPLFEPSMEM